MTVLGPVASVELGVTLPHEHVFIDMFRVNRNIATTFDEPERMAFELSRFAATGGGTIVDVTPRNVGRRPDLLLRVARETGLHIIMATGWYREPWYEPVVARSSVDGCARLLIEEIEHGDVATGVRPGIIGELGTDEAWVSPIEERGFRAAARAHRATDLTLTTHAFGSPVGLVQLDLLEEEGVAPGRVIVGHCDTHLDGDYLDALIARGAWIEFDTIRVRNEWDFRRRAEALERIVERNRGHQVLLSQDICSRDLLATNGGEGYTCLVAQFLPYLLERGRLSEDEVQRLTTTNPQRALVGEPEPW